MTPPTDMQQHLTTDLMRRMPALFGKPRGPTPADAEDFLKGALYRLDQSIKGAGTYEAARGCMEAALCLAETALLLLDPRGAAQRRVLDEARRAIDVSLFQGRFGAQLVRGENLDLVPLIRAARHAVEAHRTDTDADADAAFHVAHFACAMITYACPWQLSPATAEAAGALMRRALVPSPRAFKRLLRGLREGTEEMVTLSALMRLGVAHVVIAPALPGQDAAGESEPWDLDAYAISVGACHTSRLVSSSSSGKTPTTLEVAASCEKHRRFVDRFIAVTRHDVLLTGVAYEPAERLVRPIKA